MHVRIMEEVIHASNISSPHIRSHTQLQRYSDVKKLEEKYWPSDGLLKRVSWRVKGALSWESKYDMMERRHQELLAILTRILDTPELLGRRAARRLMGVDELEELIEYRRNPPRDFMQGKKEHTYFAMKTNEEIAASTVEEKALIARQEKRVLEVVIEAWEEELVIGA